MIWVFLFGIDVRNTEVQNELFGNENTGIHIQNPKLLKSGFQEICPTFMLLRGHCWDLLGHSW